MQKPKTPKLKTPKLKTPKPKTKPKPKSSSPKTSKPKETPWFKRLSLGLKTLSSGVWRGAQNAIVKNATFLGIWIVAGILRFGWLDHHSLWIDELLTIEDAFGLDVTKPFSRTHWLSFLFYRAAAHLGDTEFSLRFPSALAGWLGLPPFYYLMRQGFSKTNALVMTAVLAILPFHIHHSTDARYYTMMFFFSASGLMFLARFCLKASLTSLILFFVCAGANYLCHIASAPASLGAFVGAIAWVLWKWKTWGQTFQRRFSEQRKRLFSWFAWMLLVGKILLLLGILGAGCYVGYRYQIQSIIRQWKQPLPQYIEFSRAFFWRHLGGFAQGRHRIPGWPLYHVGGAFALIGAVAMWKRHRCHALLFTSVYAFGLGMLFLSRATIPYTPKYSSAIVPAFVGWLGFGAIISGQWLAARLRKSPNSAWSWIPLIVLGVLCSRALFRHYTLPYMPIKETLQYVEKHSEDVKPCVVGVSMANFVMARYVDRGKCSLLDELKYKAEWPNVSLTRFLQSMSESEIPTWVAAIRNHSADAKPTMSRGSWTQETALKSLTTSYDMLIWRGEPTNSETQTKSSALSGQGRRYEAEFFQNIRPRWAGVVDLGKGREAAGGHKNNID